jgi:hypothetical protein
MAIFYIKMTEEDLISTGYKYHGRHIYIKTPFSCILRGDCAHFQIILYNYSFLKEVYTKEELLKEERKYYLEKLKKLQKDVIACEEIIKLYDSLL